MDIEPNEFERTAAPPPAPAVAAADVVAPAPARRSDVLQVGDVVEYAGRQETVTGLAFRGHDDGDVMLSGGERVPLAQVRRL